MKKVVLYSPGLCSYNTGDKVISESAKQQLKELLEESFVTELPTHTPLSFYYARPLIRSDHKIVLGSNLLKSTFFGFKRQWDVGLLNSLYVGPCVLMGVGWWQYFNKPNLYTKVLYRKLLSKEYVHSVRDEYTVKMLKSMGIHNVVNTGCPTIWSLNDDHCNEIARAKPGKVVFTITDYNKDPVSDLALIKLLINNYDEVYFWPQGIKDFSYVKDLGVMSEVSLVSPSLSSFDALLEAGGIDYVGTRLHAGIRALQKKARTIIISIDNRAEEKRRDFNLPVVGRSDISQIDGMINSEYKIQLRLPIESIEMWKSQFR